MIGQKELIKKIGENIIKNNLSHFITVCAPSGYGKHTLCSEISKLLNAEMIVVDNKVDSIRSTITMIYSQTQPLLYVFEDADTMSINSKNSLLKVCEEPPQSAYIVLLTENKENILPTILSRTQLFELSNYTQQELGEYLSSKDLSSNTKQMILSISNCPGDIEKFLMQNNNELVSFANKVVGNLRRVSLSNALKICKQISLNKTSDGFDSILFLNSIIIECKNNFIKTRDNKYLEFSKYASNTKHNLSLAYINKNYEFDNFIIKGWSLWNCHN